MKGDYIMRKMYSKKQIEAMAKVVADSEFDSKLPTAEIGASQIDTGEQADGKVMMADGVGGVKFGSVDSSKISTGEQADGKVMMADGDGGVKFGDVSGGGSKYAHFIKFINYGYTNSFVALIICDREQAFTLEALGQWLYQNGYTSTSNLFLSIFSGTGSSSSAYPSIDSVSGIYSQSNDSQNVKAYIREDRFTTDGSSITITTSYSEIKILSISTDSVIVL